MKEPTNGQEVSEMLSRQNAAESIEILESLVSKDRKYKNNDVLLALLEHVNYIHSSEKAKELKEEYEGLKFNYNKFSVQKSISHIISALNGFIAFSEEAYQDVGTMDKATQDILHAIELCELSEKEQGEMFDKLKEIRLMRRKAKNFLYLAEEMKNVALKNKEFIKQVQKAQAVYTETKKRLEESKYTPRVLTAMEDAFLKAKEVNAEQNTDKQTAV